MTLYHPGETQCYIHHDHDLCVLQASGWKHQQRLGIRVPGSPHHARVRGAAEQLQEGESES